MKQFKIAGITYDLLELNNEQMGGNIGLADFNRQNIRINTDHTPVTQKVAVLHEILHLLDSTYGLNLSEEQVVHLTHALFSFIMDNKEFTHEHFLS